MTRTALLLLLLPMAGITAAAQVDPVVMNGVSIPSDFPYMRVLSSDNPAPGYIFLNNWGGQPYNMILDISGAPVWYWRTPDRRRDFKVQPNGWLTMLVREGYGGGEGYIALDATYSVVDTMRTTNGYFTDEHELTMLPDGQYFLIGRREETVDMSQYVAGGQTNATVRETVVQEFNPQGDMVFQWRSWDNYDIRDVELDNLQGAYIRFPHLNAISIDDDGHILVSARHLSEVTKINRQTGSIIWRLGGAHNQFTWIDDPFNGFANQHDIRALGNNRYTIFDNGNGHSPPETRALEYEIDPVNMTATLVWQYRHSPARYTSWMGNAQRLPNGNTQINYADASLPKVVEVRPDGSKALEMDFVNAANSYRAFKFDWEGNARRPYLLVQSLPTQVTLLFNKFGDTDIDHYNIYGGLQPNPTDVFATSTRPFAHLSGLANQTEYFFRVTAVSAAGVESDYSNEERVFVNLVEPGANLVSNGEFSQGTAHWVFEVTGGAQASLAITAQELGVLISSAGTELWNIQLRQGRLPLVQGREYRFEFDAFADAPRSFEAKVTKDGDPWTNYGRIGLTGLTTRRKHFSYDFVMHDPSDLEARVVFNFGQSDASVLMDNVSLKELVPSTIVDESVPAVPQLTLYPSFPNPVSGETAVRYDLPESGRVTLRVFDLLGRVVRTLVDADQAAGTHKTVFDVSALTSGVYYSRLEIVGLTGPRSSAVSRIVVVK